MELQSEVFLKKAQKNHVIKINDLYLRINIAVKMLNICREERMGRV
jgi:hypothetical protein